MTEVRRDFQVDSRSSERPAILFLVPGDVQRQTGGSLYNRKLAEGLIERGFQVDIMSLPDLPYFAGLAASLVVFPLILFRLARRRFDVVIEDGWAHPAAFLFNVAIRLSKVRLVIIAHQMRWPAVRKPVRFIARQIERIAFSSAQLVVAVSEFISGEVDRLIGGDINIAIASPGSVAILGSGHPSRDAGERPLRLLFVGNCTRIKGLDYLIEALGLLRDVDLTLDVVGDLHLQPAYSRSLIEKAETLAIEDRIAFHGMVACEDMGRFYSSGDIFTFPSLYEGFGIVLAEAMQAGLSIVATRTGSVNEVVSEDQNALIVPPADSAALARAIRRLASDPAMRRRFGERSLDLAGSLPTWTQACDTVSDRIKVMIRTIPDMTQRTKTIPTP